MSSSDRPKPKLSPHDRARRRLLKLASWSPPAILVLSAFAGFGYGNGPSPSVGTAAKPDAQSFANPQ